MPTYASFLESYPAPTDVRGPEAADPQLKIRRGGFARLFLHTLKLILLEARPPIVFVFMVRFTAADDGFTRESSRQVFLLAGWSMLTISAYVFNGLSDLAADRANGSKRPLASGRLSTVTAQTWAITLAVIGLIDCWVAGNELIFACAGGALILGWAYSAGPRLKRWTCTSVCVIGGSAALTYTAASISIGASDKARLGLLLCGVWIGAASVVKDLSDVRGDERDGRRTLPVIHGVASAIRRMVFLVVVSGAAAGAGILWVDRPLWPVAAVLCGGAVSAGIALAMLDPANASRAMRRPYKVFFAAQLAINLLLAVLFA